MTDTKSVRKYDIRNSDCSVASSRKMEYPLVTQSSYEDVMKATLSTINIFQSSTQRRNKRVMIASTPSIDSKYQVDTPSVLCSLDTRNSFCDETLGTLSSESLDESILMNFCEPEKHLNCIELQKSVENIELANEMYNNLERLLNSKKDSDVGTFIKDISVDIIQPANISNAIGKMKSVLCHLQNVVAERDKLKQVLRSTCFSDVWHMNKEYHKSVVNFFALASQLVKNIGSLITALECRKEFNNDEIKILQKRKMELMQLLYTYMDNLEKLRSFVKQHGGS